MLSGKVAPIMPWTATVILIIAALGSIVFLFIRNENLKPSFFVNLFKVSLFWIIVRVIGAVLAVLVVLQVGPEAIWSENTGGLLLKRRRSCYIPIYNFPFCWTSPTTPFKLRFTRVFRNNDGESHASFI